MLDALDELSLRWRRHKAAAAEIAAEEARREQANALELFDAEMAEAKVSAPERLAGAQERRSILEGRKEPASAPTDVYSSPPLVFYFD